MSVLRAQQKLVLLFDLKLYGVTRKLVLLTFAFASCVTQSIFKLQDLVLVRYEYSVPAGSLLLLISMLNGYTSMSI